jgi:hypothetical protein
VTPVPPSGIAGSGAESFAARFDEEFIRLDRLHGSHNFVWLSDLRRSLSEFSREQFDGGVNKLREARRYQLNAAEGRSGTSSEQLEASIVEIGVRYIAISRLRP